MNLKYLFLGIIFLCSISTNAQKTTISPTKKPVSIYTISNLLDSKNSFSVINKKLKLTNFRFVFVDLIDLDTNVFSVNFNDIGRTPSTFIYDDYRSYQDDNLLKGFIEKNDPSYWNLQCPQPNLHPYE